MMSLNELPYLRIQHIHNYKGTCQFLICTRFPINLVKIQKLVFSHDKQFECLKKSKRVGSIDWILANKLPLLSFKDLSSVQY